MSLINLRTNLKDLKFGNDEYGGGSSKQPFIQTRIPATDEPLQTSFSLTGNNLTQGLGSVALSAGAGALIGGIVGPAGAIAGAALGLGIGIAGAVNTQDLKINLKIPVAGTGGTDFLLRGGTLLPGIIANDEERLFKFFKSTDGVLFTVKQNLLSRIAVRTQASTGLLNDGVYTPTSTLLQAAGNPFGLHVNKQGSNPLSGLSEAYNPNYYFDAIKNQIVKANTVGVSYAFPNNRLIALTTAKFSLANALNSYPNQYGSSRPDFYFDQRIYDNNDISKDPSILLRYSGGPGSFLGIGKTNIRYATDNEGAPLSAVNIINLPTYTQNLTEISETSDETHVQNSSFNGTQIVDFRTRLQKYLGEFPKYSGTDAKNIETRVELGNPGDPFDKNLISYTSGSGQIKKHTKFVPAVFDAKGNIITKSKNILTDDPEYSPDYGAASFYSYDKINASLDDTNRVHNDLIKFKIGVVNNTDPSKTTNYYFRAFLNTITDNYTGNWESTKYIGRGENFYTYSGFDRKISLSWTVAAQSKAELMPMYYRLNNLASMTSPDYSTKGYMRGNISQLTIGGYITNQYGIINSINYTMNEESDSWEIAIDTEGKSDNSVRELPHIIRVSMEFTPIHNFAPSLNEPFIYAKTWFDDHFITQI